MKIIAYHEVSDPIVNQNKTNIITPLYNLDIKQFESQIQYFHKSGFKAIIPDEIRQLHEEQKTIMITFDDGLEGNYHHAYPILKKYGFKATFFIATGLIEKERYMNWEQIKKMHDDGMSIQSHAINHQALELLNDKKVYAELSGSKDKIEKELKNQVSSISFPHGSYNRKTINFAMKVGYRYMFTSNIENPFVRKKSNKKSIYGRVMITKNMKNKQILDIINKQGKNYYRLYVGKTLKNTLKKLIGIDNYKKLYRRKFNIKVQE